MSRKAVAALAAAVAFVPICQAGNIRDDRSDSDYLALGSQSKYSVGGATFQFGAGIASGTLISPRWVLTAGHVVDSTTTSQHRFKVGLNLSTATIYTASTYFPHPSWNRNNIPGGFDLGLMKLSSPVTEWTPAARYTRSDEVGQLGTSVGFGLHGTGSSPNGTLDGNRRAGQNTIDALGDTAYGGNSAILAADFDDPDNADGKNPFGSPDPVNLEYCVASGDSGGGMFLDVGGTTFVAGVHSFVDAFDPPVGDGTDNSSYSDTYGSTRISAFNSWIDDQITNSWRVAANGNFASAGNWNVSIPDQYDIAGFNVAGTYSVNFVFNEFSDRIIQRDGNVTFTLNGTTYTIGSTTVEGSVIVGRYGGNAASLTIAGGTLATKDIVLAQDAGSSGTLIVGAGGILNANGNVYVGGEYLGAGGTGVLNVNTGGAASISGTIKAFANGTINYNGGTFNAGGINLVGGGKMIVSPATGGARKFLHAGTLSIDTVTGSKIDLASNAMIASAASTGSWNGSAYTGVAGLIATGRNGGAWTGGGIVTSQTAAKSPNTLTTLGVAASSDALGITAGQTATWFGNTVSAGDTLVLYTFAGDANLDGVISGDDYFQIDSSFPQHLRGYFHGDFDFNGVINGDDYFLIDSNFPQQSAFPPSGVEGVIAVPEPSSAVAVFAAAAACMTSRSRQRSRSG